MVCCLALTTIQTTMPQTLRKKADMASFFIERGINRHVDLRPMGIFSGVLTHMLDFLVSVRGLLDSRESLVIHCICGDSGETFDVDGQESSEVRSRSLEISE